MYAIGQNSDIPIGTQDAELLDTRNSDEDADSVVISNFDSEETEDDSEHLSVANIPVGEKHFGSKSLLITNELSAGMLRPDQIEMHPDDSGELLDIEAELLFNKKSFKQRAEVVYGEYKTRYQRRFKWLKCAS
ncbi:MAG: hypothetical protein JGK03_10340 [Microcoleus sp. PH2017_25_DOB_D_A]|uniref:hypothetical protein n=1 Tax=unclassified Microcoleus TaxID=2642155 RepID=UPI001DB08653|nr:MULTISPECIES: hypothetical protein [unclassified Microcoleus]MCC3446118.1 hypothetical protein [Microcoleus sp. PH2017_09_SFU_O_A]MCC3492128.1 hypothetical protein [Microcoleus sp. PH2017_16_JOR_D_A]MCC3498476.1 hypothetical protein [Microcoleus sp. PH2017_15_JOR_U_A]MCC3534578.1 hypothetical protein [Microcoleus sp. PH2017_25_DOB_D_A]MCC3546921.1 hypothetical protein [Microcoleus sp. PH2017_24_DOB_U_A]